MSIRMMCSLREMTEPKMMEDRSAHSKNLTAEGTEGLNKTPWQYYVNNKQNRSRFSSLRLRKIRIILILSLIHI